MKSLAANRISGYLQRAGDRDVVANDLCDKAEVLVGEFADV